MNTLLSTNWLEHFMNLEYKLAELLGWTDLELHTVNDSEDLEGASLSGYPPGNQGMERAILPPWTRNGERAFQLMVEHQCFPQLSPNLSAIEVRYATNLGVLVPFKEHPDQETAIRLAIVTAAVRKLEQARISQIANSRSPEGYAVVMS